MFIHTLDDLTLALTTQVFGSAPLVTLTVAGHTAETNANRIARELVASLPPPPRQGMVAKILAAISEIPFRIFGKQRRVDHFIHLWYTLPENSLNGEAQLRRLFIAPSDVSWGPLIKITDRPDIDAILTRLVAAWRV